MAKRDFKNAQKVEIKQLIEVPKTASVIKNDDEFLNLENEKFNIYFVSNQNYRRKLRLMKDKLNIPMGDIIHLALDDLLKKHNIK